MEHVEEEDGQPRLLLQLLLIPVKTIMEIATALERNTAIHGKIGWTNIAQKTVEHVQED